MEKLITIDGKEIGLRATALTPRLYRIKTGRDIIQDLNHLQQAMRERREALALPEPAEDAAPEVRKTYETRIREAQLSVLDLELFENIAWIMARQYAKKHPEAPAIPGSPEEWLDDLPGVFDIAQVLGDVLSLWGMQQQTTTEPKNA